MTFPVLAFVAIVGVLVAVAPMVGADYHLRRIIRFQRRRFKDIEDVSVVQALRDTDEKREVSLADVRDLVISLQLGTSMESTLTGALDKAAEQFAGRGVLGERLRRHVDARLSISPEAVLEGLVEDFDCPQLVELLDRIRMASGGGISYNRVLAVTAATIEEDMRGNIEAEIQRAPTRLTIPMVVGVFFPAIILGLLPLMAFAVNQMQ